MSNWVFSVFIGSAAFERQFPFNRNGNELQVSDQSQGVAHVVQEVDQESHFDIAFLDGISVTVDTMNDGVKEGGHRGGKTGDGLKEFFKISKQFSI